MSAPRFSKEARSIETSTTIAAVPLARMFRTYRHRSGTELALLGVLVVVVWIVNAVRRSSGAPPGNGSMFRRFRR